TAKAYKEAVAETNGRAKAKVKKKRSLVKEHYYEEFFTKFWKESESQQFAKANATSSNTLSRSQPSRIPRPSVTSHPQVSQDLELQKFLKEFLLLIDRV
ncbi:3231_t:CDS:2, partial [Funneliformis mosseae]